MGHQRTNQPGLNDLPDKILERIATYQLAHTLTAPHDAPLDIYSFGLVSKKFHRVAQPLLHSVFINDNNPRLLRRFLTKITRTPELALALRNIVIGEYLGTFSSSHTTEPAGQRKPCEEEQWRGYAQQLALFGERERSLWISSLERDEYEAQVALLLALAQNVQSVDITYGYFGFDQDYTSWIVRLVSWVIQHAPSGGQRGPLSSLRHFVLREPARVVYPGDYRFWEICMLPSIRTIELHHLTETRTGYPHWLEKISNTEALVIRPRSPTTRLFANILRSCRAVRAATYIWDPLDDREKPVDIDSIFAALLLHRSSLRSLALRCSIDHKSLPHPGPLQSLRAFSNLRNLHISTAFLQTIAVEHGEVLDEEGGIMAPVIMRFPQCLETLVVECTSMGPEYWPTLMAFLLAIRRARSSYFPNLHTVKGLVPAYLWETALGDQRWRFASEYTVSTIVPPGGTYEAGEVEVIFKALASEKQELAT